LLDDILYNRLVCWVTKHYREELSPNDLADPKLLDESRAALAELGAILELDDLAHEKTTGERLSAGGALQA
jgi:succinylarginine dihydrolase